MSAALFAALDILDLLLSCLCSKLQTLPGEMACLKRDAITAEDVLASLPISDSAWKVIAVAVGHVLLFSPLCLGEQKLSGHSCSKFAGTSVFPWRMIQTNRKDNEQ